MTRLSTNFTLKEMTASATARKIGDPNQPPAATVAALRDLCVHVLEPVRAHFGRPVRINSAYRSARVNAAVGSKPGSQHRIGQAADIEVEGVSNADVARWIRDTIDFDQLILEAHRPGKPDSGWVHVSWRPERRRGKDGPGGVLTMTLGSHGAVYTAGINA
jgi:zinc D-Ala-D-Ala carboxypeptidase